MANRLSQIATRTGDDGTTGLGDGTRVPKDHLRVQAMGDVDELNSQLGVLLAEKLPDDVRESLAATVPFPPRLGLPDDYAGLVLHIVGNRYLNGETIRLDGALRMAPR